MSASDSDISWASLRQLLHRSFGDSVADLAEVSPLVGGCINCTLRLTLADGFKCVLKVSPHRVTNIFVEEAHQLNILGQAGVPVPRVFDAVVGDLDHPFSYVVMEYVDGIDLATARRTLTATEFDDVQRQIATLLRELHQRTGDHYARVTSAAMGATFERWPEFFRSIYDDIFAEVTNCRHLPLKSRKQIGRIHERLPALLAHDDCPRLVHWDLWCGNILVKPNPTTGRCELAAIIDPNAKYAHAEAELAYLELFRTATPTLLSTYQQDQRFPSDYHRLRKPIYQLYQLLNHVRLFGQEYANHTQQVLSRIPA
jgi:fructosamine-3-kinase